MEKKGRFLYYVFMVKITTVSFFFLLFCSACTSFGGNLPGGEGYVWKPGGNGVRWASYDQGNQRFFLLDVDLGAGVRVDLFSSRQGARVSDFAREYGLDWCVNGGAYLVEGRENRHLVPWALWKSSFLCHDRGGGVVRAGELALVQGADQRWSIVKMETLTGNEVQVGGSFGSLIWQGKKLISRFGSQELSKRDPRTAVGLDVQGRHLFLLVADGRSPGAAGLTLGEAAEVLQGLGAWMAFNWDGGGSSDLVQNQEDHPLPVNHPVGGLFLGGERPVATVLGIRSKP